MTGSAPPPDEPYLKLSEITKRFGKFTALSAITLAVERGKLMIFLGPSGCGKTTLLRIIAGLDREGDAGERGELPEPLGDSGELEVRLVGGNGRRGHGLICETLVKSVRGELVEPRTDSRMRISGNYRSPFDKLRANG